MKTNQLFIHFRKNTFSALPANTQVILFNQPKLNAEFYLALNSFVESHFSDISNLCKAHNYDFCFLPHTLEKWKNTMGQELLDAIRYFHPDASEVSDSLDDSMKFNLSDFVSDDDGAELHPGLICYAGEKFDAPDRYTFFYLEFPDSIRKALILNNLTTDEFSGFLTDFIRFVKVLRHEEHDIFYSSLDACYDEESDQESVVLHTLQQNTDTDFDFPNQIDDFSLECLIKEESKPKKEAEPSENKDSCISQSECEQYPLAEDKTQSDAEKKNENKKEGGRFGSSSMSRICLNKKAVAPPLISKTLSKVGAAIGGLVDGMLASVSMPSFLSLATASAMFSDRADSNFADLHFSDEVKDKLIKFKVLAIELIKNGVEGWLLEKLLRPSRQLSRLHIHGVRIFLTDYNNMEIEMGPLPKTVFFFYLRHPEGVRFRDLRKYRDELWKIYGVLNTKEDQVKAQKSIDELIDSSKNRINEKVNAVQKAFVTRFDPELAKNYYITGKRAMPKKIILDRSLVTWDGVLADL